MKKITFPDISFNFSLLRLFIFSTVIFILNVQQKVSATQHGGSGPAVYELTPAHIEALTGDNTAPEGNYSFVEEGGVMVAKEMEWDNGNWVVIAGTSPRNLMSAYPTITEVEDYMATNGIPQNHGGQGSGPAVYELTPAHIEALTGDNTAPEGNYSFVEEGGVMVAKEMEWDNGNWVVIAGTSPRNLMSAYPTITEVEDYMATNGIPQNHGGQGSGPAVYELTPAHIEALTGDNTAPEGNYSFVEEGGVMVAKEMEWDNGNWVVIAGTSPRNLMSAYPTITEVEDYMATNGIPQNHGGQGSGPAVYELTPAHIEALTGDNTAPEGNYSFVEEGGVMVAKEMEWDNGNWVVIAGTSPRNLMSAYPTITEVEDYMATNGIPQNHGGQGSGPAVYELTPAHIEALTGDNTAPEGNYSFVEEGGVMVAKEMEWDNGNWVVIAGTSPRNLMSAYPTITEVEDYMATNGIPQNHGGQGSGPAVYELTPAHIEALTGDNTAPEGNYSFVEEGGVMVAKEMEWDNGNWVVIAGTSPRNLMSAYPTITEVEDYMATNGIPQNHGGQGSGPAVYELTPAHIEALTGDNTAPEGNYSFVEEGGVMVAKEMEWDNGNWVVIAGTSPRNLMSAYPTITEVEDYMATNGIPQNHGGQGSGPAVYELTPAHIEALTGDNTAPEGNYSFVEEGGVMVAKEMEWDNGNWVVIAGTSPRNLMSAYPTITEVEDYMATNGIPQNHGGQGSGPAVYELTPAHIEALTGSASAQEGNYSIVEQDDGQGPYLVIKPMELVAGNWQEDTNGAPYPLDPSISTMAQVETYLTNNNIEPVDPGTGPGDGNDSDPEGMPIFALSITQAEILADGIAPAGNYAFEIFLDQGGVEIRQLVGVTEVAGNWERSINQNGQQVIYPISSAYFPTLESIEAWSVQQNLEPIGFLSEHHDPGTGPGDGNDSDPEGMPIFALSITQAETLVDGIAPAGNYAFEIFLDQGGVEIRQLVGVTEVAGNWERSINQNGQQVIYPISSAYFPTLESIEAWTVQQNLEPIGFLSEHHDPGTGPGDGNDPDPEGMPIFALSITQAEILADGIAPAGNYAFEIFLDQGGVEIRQLVGVTEVAGNWERSINQNGQQVIYPISSAYFPTLESIEAWTVQQNLEPIGFLSEHHDPGTGPGDGNDPDPEGMPIFALSITQAEILADGIAPAGNYAFEIFLDQGGVEIRQLVGVTEVAGNWERSINQNGQQVIYPISSAYFPTLESIEAWTVQQNLEPIGFLSEHHDPGTGPGDGNDPDPEGMPIFALSITQAEILADGIAPAGNYAFEIFLDQGGVEIRQLVGVTEVAGNWERSINQNGQQVIYPISSAYFPTLESIEAWTDQQNLEPIGFLMEDPDDHEDDGPFDFTIIGEVDLTNPQNLFELATSHDSIWFQKWATPENLDNIYWALSIESNNSNISSLVVDMNGSIYSGNFHSYWRDAFGIIADYENEESDWKEYRYDPSETSIQKLYDDAPELYGQDRPLPPIVKTAGNPIFRNNFIQVSAYIESLGNNPDLIFGFQVSDSIFFDQAEEIIVQGNFAEGDLLETSFDFSYLEADRLYYRAFARNSLFESFGTKKRARMPVIETIPPTLFPDAERLEDGWKENWLGVFHEYSNGWMYHLDLGWCFASPDNNGNVWLWINDHGWVWTNGSTWPHLYRNETSSWLYLLIRQSGPAVFFDQMHGSFMHLNK